jgi:hypothetical protein
VAAAEIFFDCFCLRGRFDDDELHFISSRIRVNVGSASSGRQAGHSSIVLVAATSFDLVAISNSVLGRIHRCEVRQERPTERRSPWELANSRISPFGTGPMVPECLELLFKRSSDARVAAVSKSRPMFTAR